MSKPVLGAEKIRISYGPLEFPLSAESLETFAESGKVTGDLKFYAQFLRPPILAKLRQFLKQRFQVSPVVVSELTYSPMGERVLQGLGQMIRTQARQNGFYALRSALILAASDLQGMSVTDIIRYFPTSSIRINAAQLLELEQQFQFSDRKRGMV